MAERSSTLTRLCEVVNFAPDAFVDRRLPLGAIITERLGGARVVRSDHLPDWKCSGGWEAAALAEAAWHALEHWQPLESSVPVGFEEVLVRDEAVALPAEWGEQEIRKHIWGTGAGGAPRGAHARTLGRRFFQSRGVAGFVRDQLDPLAFAAGRYAAASAGGTVSQYVVGKHEQLLLLEPVRHDASKEALEDTIKRLAVWQRAAARHHESWPRVSLVAYAVSEPRVGSVRPRDERLLVQFKDFADYTFDTDVSAQANELVDAVRAAAA
jgi:hypothetical protein